MTYQKLIGAVPGLQKLTGQDLPLRTAYRLSKMVRKANEELAFFRMKHEEIMKAETEEEEKRRLFEELLRFEADWSPDPIRIPEDTNIRLSGSDIAALEGLVEITEEEDHERDHDQRAE